MTKLILFSLCWLTIPSFGTSFPFAMPNSEVDAAIFGNTEPAAFFRERARSAPRCRARLGTVKQEFKASREALQKAIDTAKPSGVIDGLEIESDEIRHRYHDTIAECGHCAIRPIEKKVRVTPKGNEIWYMVNGSCWLPGAKTEAGIKRVYQARKKSLSWTKYYPKYSGGYPQIYEFREIERKTGVLAPSRHLSSPFLGYMAIRGPEIFSTPTAFDYTFEGNIRDHRSGLTFDFAYAPPPRRFRGPRVYDHRASGRKVRVRMLHVRDVAGKWYVTQDGYLRFFMAADLKMDLDFAKTVARRTLLDSLVHFAGVGVSND